MILVRGVDVGLHGSRGVELNHLEAGAQGEGETRGGEADSEELSWLRGSLRARSCSVGGGSLRGSPCIFGYLSDSGPFCQRDLIL